MLEWMEKESTPKNSFKDEERSESGLSAVTIPRRPRISRPPVTRDVTLPTLTVP